MNVHRKYQITILNREMFQFFPINILDSGKSDECIDFIPICIFGLIYLKKLIDIFTQNHLLTKFVLL